jgi:hypothetical protein
MVTPPTPAVRTLFFLPWVSCSEPVHLGAVCLIPYVRKKRPGLLGRITQEMIDAVLGRYGDRKYGINRDTAQPISKATIVCWKCDNDTEDVSEETAAAFGQALTFSALSRRRYGSHARYYNADTLTLVAQPFHEASPHQLSVYSRRRDGGCNNLIGTSAGLPVFMRPIHVEMNPVIEIDEELVFAITNLSNPSLRDRVSTSIALYNRANTDAIDVPAASEIVMLRAAMETLLDASFRSESLRNALNAHLRGELDAPMWHEGDLSEGTWRARWPNDVDRPIDAWIQDFCASRNTSAHGNARSAPADTVWSVHEHMLFGSWLFPLLVKGVLADSGVYTLNELDRQSRKECERFFAYRIFRLVKGEKLAWSLVEDELLLRDIARRMYPYM